MKKCIWYNCSNSHILMKISIYNNLNDNHRSIIYALENRRPLSIFLLRMRYKSNTSQPRACHYQNEYNVFYINSWQKSLYNHIHKVYSRMIRPAVYTFCEFTFVDYILDFKKGLATWCRSRCSSAFKKYICPFWNGLKRIYTYLRPQSCECVYFTSETSQY